MSGVGDSEFDPSRLEQRDTQVFGACNEWFIALARQFAVNQIVDAEADAQLAAGISLKNRGSQYVLRPVWPMKLP